MKKVPYWIQKVILASQKVWCADTRNFLLNQMIEGNFNYDNFKTQCMHTYNIKIDGELTTANSYEEATKLCDTNFIPINLWILISN
jgi:hypothetical protein